MPQIQKMLTCKGCNHKTPHLQNTPNHILHLLLTVVTAGVWLVVWFLLSMIPTSVPTCSQCGKKSWFNL
jgi:hypothetical protein